MEMNVVVEFRPIEVITSELQFYKAQAGGALLEIGKRLLEAKEQLAHGEWLPWLRDKAEFSEATAQRFMRLAKEYANPSRVTDLGAYKALVLLALPASERDEFIEGKHEVNGTEKSVFDMTKKELEQAVRERDAARREAVEARKAIDEQVAQRVKEHDAALMKERKRADEASRTLQEAEAELEMLRQTMETAQKIETIREPPAPDPKMLDAARKEAAQKAKADAEATLKKKIEAAQAEKEKAERAKTEAEKAVAAARAELEEARQLAAREAELLRGQNAELAKKLTVASSSEMQIFKVHFEAAQADANKMIDCITRMEEAGDTAGAAKLRGAAAAFFRAALQGLDI